MKCIVWTSFIVLLGVWSASYAQGQGANISISVVNEEDIPLIGATVWVLPLSGSAQVNAVPSCLTDWTGTCVVPHLSGGKYQINAMKESDGYPNWDAPLFGKHRRGTFAEVKQNSGTLYVSYKTGPRAAVIILNIKDKQELNQITNPTVILRSTSDPKIWMSVSPDMRSRILVPPDGDVRLEISAEGYKPMDIDLRSYSSQNAGAQIHSGGSTPVNIELEKEGRHS